MSDRPAETEYSALQALLKIRTEGGESNATGEVAEASAAPANASASQKASANANIANLLRMNASTASMLQQRAQMASSYSPTQMAAIRAAAAATLQNPNGGLMQAAALQNPSFAVRSPFLEAMARDPSLAAATTVGTAPRSPALDLPRASVLSPLRPAPPRGASQTGAISPTGQSVDGVGNDSSGAAAAEKKVRKGEVEAALRSKPQRGRKRENLNAEERLELTRTRNREHAKSTR